MKITEIHSWVEHFPLHRPYTIAFRSIAAVDNVILTLGSAEGLVGLGAASPEPYVTGETTSSCRAALEKPALAWLLGRDVRELTALCRELSQRLPANPAARAAVDIALHDLLAQHLRVPLVTLLGRVHTNLPTSITIGIKPLAETLKEAQEYVNRGFCILKVKLGHDLNTDIARLQELRQRFGATVAIRVDPNQGYDHNQVLDFVARTSDLAIELLEQPLGVGATASARALPQAVRQRMVADECLLDETDALDLLTSPRPYGVFNIKLMKCGGLRSALRIAAMAEAAGIELMWGCMDESRISISAALHGAFASPATRYLDLDGSFDLAQDIVKGGFILENGCLRTTDMPGLGVQKIS